jgi:HlyD family secretion protein
VFKDYLVNGFYSRKRALLEQDISSLTTASRTIRDQQELTTKDVALAQETYNMNKLLFDEKLSSREEFRQEESRLLSKKLAVPQLEAAIQANLDQARDKLKEIAQLDHDQAQQETLFSQALHSLKSAVDDWKLRHILQSPVDGSVSFIIHLQENQFLQAGTLIGYISPGDAYYYTEAYLPQGNFGKIDTGLKVQLRFDAYPYQEAGFVEGTLDNLSSVASDSGILATIRLDKGLRTNNHRVIAYRSGLKAQAIVITKQMRLLQRLWYNINKSTSLQGK